MNKLFSFIIISYNRPDDTIEAVRNVLQLDDAPGYDKEIIILNNGSSVSYTTFEAYLNTIPAGQQANLHYINHPENLGVAGGRNLCIRQAKGEYLFFLDDDAEVATKNAIPLVLEKFKKYEPENIRLIGFSTMNPFTGQYDNPVKGRDKRENEKEFFYNIFWGCGHVFRKDLIAETGFYQDDFFYGMEEYDLAYATIKKGYTLLFTKDILVLHKFNPSGREPSKLTYARMFENKTLVAWKHLPLLYVVTHFMIWSGYFLLKSKGAILLYFRTLKSLYTRMKAAKREVMNAKGMDYLRKVGARITY
jgi:GT2 family glycosyltransferase